MHGFISMQNGIHFRSQSAGSFFSQDDSDSATTWPSTDAFTSKRWRHLAGQACGLDAHEVPDDGPAEVCLLTCASQAVDPSDSSSPLRAIASMSSTSA
jgi:hypothetical protein